ncbi:MAG: LysM peptidoglycan-binding domain-containing protein [Actinomycetota bacterium]|nr:LysM peptidoglycan-binding domain-containing protein [Actinomycetota bacterium]
MRLTSRGRFVVGLVAFLGAIAAAAAMWLAVAGRAEAAGHVQYPGRGTAGMARVVVAPGQSLWTIALRVDPTADPRIIVAEIITDNSLTGQTIQPGQVLWVPKG